MKRLCKRHAEWQILCISGLRVLTEQDVCGRWYVTGFVGFAGDGTRIERPHSSASEAAYWLKKNCKAEPVDEVASDAAAIARVDHQEGQEPQLWLTLLGRVDMGLPCAWRTGLLNSSGGSTSRNAVGTAGEHLNYSGCRPRGLRDCDRRAEDRA